mmetsp:Transcript_34565/g.25692  ORF Transcript_34565/g.25692 Transcript_34565/m.25692 type:complete len:90 (-) Transcript_34565:322-591(-)
MPQQEDYQDGVASYLSQYREVPLTKDEVAGYEALKALKENPHIQRMRVKRMGADVDDLFWAYGKVHGLENIAFASDEDIKRVDGNPVEI